MNCTLNQRPWGRTHLLPVSLRLLAEYSPYSYKAEVSTPLLTITWELLLVSKGHLHPLTHSSHIFKVSVPQLSFMLQSSDLPFVAGQKKSFHF